MGLPGVFTSPFEDHFTLHAQRTRTVCGRRERARRPRSGRVRSFAGLLAIAAPLQFTQLSTAASSSPRPQENSASNSPLPTASLSCSS